jgi:hypothetical protein
MCVGIVEQGDDFIKPPHVIRDACGHRWRDAERAMHLQSEYHDSSSALDTPTNCRANNA